VYGPGKMQPDDAIEKYKERRVRDAQAPIGSTDFDELDASDGSKYGSVARHEANAGLPAAPSLRMVLV
jgi:hypothetical protein